MQDGYEIEVKRAGKRVALLTVHTDDPRAAWDVKEALEMGYLKSDGYVLVVHMVEVTRSRVIAVVKEGVFKMPKEAAR